MSIHVLRSLSTFAVSAVLAATVAGAPALANPVEARGERVAPETARSEIAALCPKSAPKAALREAPANFDVEKACARAVKGAATDYAALAVVYAFSKLGAPTLCPSEPGAYKKRKNGVAFDSSSLVFHAYRAAGVETPIGTTRNLFPWDGVPRVDWVRSVKDRNAKPGDVHGWLFPDRSSPKWGHAAIRISNKLVIQAATCDSVVSVAKLTGTKGDSYVGVIRARR